MQKVPDHVRKEVDKFIREHHHVINSPIANDTVRVRDPDTGEWVKKSKLLLQYSAAELLSDLHTEKLGPGKMVYDKNGNRLIRVLAVTDGCAKVGNNCDNFIHCIIHVVVTHKSVTFTAISFCHFYLFHVSSCVPVQYRFG